MGERPGEPNDENRAQLEAAIAGFPDTQLETRDEWIEREDSDFNQFISFLYVMLTLAVFVSIFGMINTLVLSVYERTREIGMPCDRNDPAAGPPDDPSGEHHHRADRRGDRAPPRDLPRPAREPRALRVRRAVRDPVVQLLVLTIVAIVIGILAAIMPARRAAKLNPLEAIAYE